MIEEEIRNGWVKQRSEQSTPQNTEHFQGNEIGWSRKRELSRDEA
jgi:hypothetical protein